MNEALVSVNGFGSAQEAKRRDAERVAQKESERQWEALKKEFNDEGTYDLPDWISEYCFYVYETVLERELAK